MKIISHFEETRDKFIADFTKKHLMEKKILDIGCGLGDGTINFCSLSSRVTGIDIIDQVKGKHKNKFKFTLADAKKLPFQNAVFDAVVSFDVIEHIDDDLTMLLEAFRVCKKKGFFLLGTPNRMRLSNCLYALIGKKVVYPYYLGPGVVHFREYTMDELVEKVERCGFKIYKTRSLFFGLVGRIDLGFAAFPKMLERYAQSLLVVARK